MYRLIRPLTSPVTYLGGTYALAGAALSIPAGVIATAALFAPGGKPVRLLLFTVIGLVVLLAAGTPAVTRRLAVELADRLLRTAIPVPTRAGGPTARWRTGCWLIVHAAAGVLVAAAIPVLLLVAVLIPGVWLSGGGHVDYLFWTIQVPSGATGAWTVLAAVIHIAAAGYLLAAVTAGLRSAAVAMLGPGAAEQLTALAAHADGLARRNRLAGELHDSIGHTLTASTIQAAVAAELFETDPAAARRALDGIERTSRAALDDLDRVLGALRAGDADPVPAGVLPDVPDLVRRSQRAGTAIDLTCDVDESRVPPAVSREAYRVVREGLTNALRYGTGDTIAVRVAGDRAWLHVVVTNRVSPAGSRPGGGRGLAGMRDRVRSLGGEFTAGPGTGDTPEWTLSVRLPVRSAP